MAQTIPNVVQPAPGTLLSGPVDPDMGRLPIIEILGPYAITIPESPGSQPGAHVTVRAWDLTDPANPVLTAPINPQPQGNFGISFSPFLAHGTIKRDNEVYIGGNNAVRLNDDGTLEHVQWSAGQAPLLLDIDGSPMGTTAPWWSKGGMMRPWGLLDNWAYNNQIGSTILTLDNQVLADWDITQDSGVSGFGNFLGNLLIYSSDQRNTGVAVYDATNISFDESTNEWKPALLDTINIPADEGGIRFCTPDRRWDTQLVSRDSGGGFFGSN